MKILLSLVFLGFSVFCAIYSAPDVGPPHPMTRVFFTALLFIPALLLFLSELRDRELRPPSRRKLRRMAARKDVTGLIRALADRRDDVDDLATKLLLELGSEAAQGLLLGLTAGQAQDDARKRVSHILTAGPAQKDDARKRVSHILGEIADPATLLRACETLMSGLPEDRALWGVIWGALSKRGKGALLTDLLCGLLRHDSGVVRSEAAQALGAVADAAAVPSLCQAMTDPVSEVRSTAASALGKIGGPEVCEALSAALQDQDGKVRVRAALALADLRDLRAVEPLCEEIISEGPLADLAAGRLGQLADPRATGPLCKALRLENWRTRANAARSLGQLKNPEAFDALCEALCDSERVVREAAGFALSALEDERAIVPLWAARQRDPQLPPMGELLISAASAAHSQRYASGPNVGEMGDYCILEVLSALCTAYVEDDRLQIGKLEPIARSIGEELHRRGGIKEMRRVFAALQGRPGARTLEMHWHGIGEWRG